MSPGLLNIQPVHSKVQFHLQEKANTFIVGLSMGLESSSVTASGRMSLNSEFRGPVHQFAGALAKATKPAAQAACQPRPS